MIVRDVCLFVVVVFVFVVVVVAVVVRESDALALLHATEECFPRERDGFPRP